MDIIRSKIIERSLNGNDDSFYIFDVEDVRLKYQKWIEKMPRVTPFYAIKSNDNSEIVKLLAELGTGFDCASKKELDQVLQLGIQSDRIIYANIVKQISHLKYAAENGIEMLTFDSVGELAKIKTIHPTAKVILRIRCDAESSMVCLGTFGCDRIKEAPQLIQMCKDLKMNLIGISFHVGSGTLDYKIYEQGIQAVKDLFGVAMDFGFKLNFVDIGGGFMGHDITLLDEYSTYINRGIHDYFSDSSVTIISEPGQYFSLSAFTLVVQIILKKISQEGRINYYINESIFQSFNKARIDIFQEYLQFKIIRRSEQPIDQLDRPSTIWGHSCHSGDRIIYDRMIPELYIGDSLIFDNMGAYTSTLSSNFNGFNTGDVIIVNRK